MDNRKQLHQVIRREICYEVHGQGLTNGEVFRSGSVLTRDMGEPEKRTSGSVAYQLHLYAPIFCFLFFFTGLRDGEPVLFRAILNSASSTTLLLKLWYCIQG